jgi:hypothetical protein
MANHVYDGGLKTTPPIEMEQQHGHNIQTECN